MTQKVRGKKYAAKNTRIRAKIMNSAWSDLTCRQVRQDTELSYFLARYSFSPLANITFLALCFSQYEDIVYLCILYVSEHLATISSNPK